ncbi:hypothetical protein V1506DRAFT_165662 [Lipomyces tetrasporus]
MAASSRSRTRSGLGGSVPCRQSPPSTSPHESQPGGLALGGESCQERDGARAAAATHVVRDLACVSFLVWFGCLLGRVYVSFLVLFAWLSWFVCVAFLVLFMLRVLSLFGAWADRR